MSVFKFPSGTTGAVTASSVSTTPEQRFPSVETWSVNGVSASNEPFLPCTRT